MISIANIAIQYGGRVLFDDISFTVTKKDRIGLVGKNGAGKSTMLKVLIGQIKSDSGSISMDNNTSLGYLPQEIKMTATESVYEETARAFDSIKQLEAQIEALGNELATRTDYESAAYLKLIDNITDAEDRLQRMGVHNIRERIERTLKGLGFVNGDFDKPLNEFSGGWQMRVELAKILLSSPDFVLLDEPTNHLDIESIIWLEGFLSNYSGGVLLISHDKAFLDRVTNRTLEIVNGKVYDYRTSYSKFVSLRAERREKQIAEAKKQEKYIEETKKLINKFRAKKNKAKFAQTLIKKLENLEKIEVDDTEKSSIRFRFPAAPRSGKVVIDIEQLSKNYGLHKVFENVNFTLERGEKIAFVGKNGEGKSTLTKIITGKEDFVGKCDLGHNVEIGYYEQHQAENLDGKQTVLQVIDDAATGDMRLRVRSLLGAFLFSGEDVEKKVSVLSGGEKSRLALAKMLLNPVNLLILDEPTNHLDMQAKNVLKQALKDYDGTLIIVSHDREFLQGMTDKVYEFRNKNVKQYFGDVYDFLEKRNIESFDDLGMNTRKAIVKEEVVLTKKQRIKQREAAKALEKNIRKLSNKISKSEKNISDLEKKAANLEREMNATDFYTANPNPNQVLANYEKVKKDLEKEMENWEQFTVELEEIQEKQEV